jgi:hypothetical protein
MENATTDRYFFAVAGLVALHALASFVLLPLASPQNMLLASVACAIYVAAFLLRTRWGYHCAIVAGIAGLFAVFWRVYHADTFQHVPFEKSRDVIQGVLSLALLPMLLSRRSRRYFYAASCV